MADIIVASFGGEHNVKGDSGREGYNDGNWMEVREFSLGGSNHYDVYHKRMSADVETHFSFVTPDGTPTAPLYEASFKTHKFALVKCVILRRVGSALEVAYSIEMKNVYLTHVGFQPSAGGGAGGDHVAVTLAYDEFKMTGKGNMPATWKHADATK